jgi:hypothetical protein
MSTPKNNNPVPPPQPKSTSNVVSLDSYRCIAEGCKVKHVRANFCGQHYDWFKSGLITAEGYKAKDFQRKFEQMQAKKAG